MTESAKKAIEEHARLDLTADHNRGPMYMASREEIRILGRIEAAEFGYQLGKDEVKSALRREIEKRKKHLTEMVRVHLKGSDVWAANENRLRELQIFEDSLDTVEP